MVGLTFRQFLKDQSICQTNLKAFADYAVSLKEWKGKSSVLSLRLYLPSDRCKEWAKAAVLYAERVMRKWHHQSPGGKWVRVYRNTAPFYDGVSCESYIEDQNWRENDAYANSGHSRLRIYTRGGQTVADLECDAYGDTETVELWVAVEGQ